VEGEAGQRSRGQRGVRRDPGDLPVSSVFRETTDFGGAFLRADDPKLGDARAGVRRGFGAVQCQRADRDLDDQPGRRRVGAFVLGWITLDHGNVRLRFGGRDGDRAFLPHPPLGRRTEATKGGNEVIDQKVVQRRLGHLLDEDAVEQLNVPICKEADVHHTVVTLHGERSDSLAHFQDVEDVDHSAGTGYPGGRTLANDAFVPRFLLSFCPGTGFHVPVTRLLLKACVALAIVWGLVAAVSAIASGNRVTPERIAADLARRPLASLTDAADRERRIREVADRINRLDYEQRQAARNLEADNGRPFRDFFEGLAPAERALFIELTIGPTFTHLMTAYNEMPAEERRRIAERTLANLNESGTLSDGDARAWEEQGPELFEKVVGEGLRAYYEDASAETKLDFAPVLESLQKTLQSPRGKWKSKPAY